MNQDGWDDEGEWNDDEADDDFESPDEDEATIACPYCREPIHEDSERCPHCERYISREDAPPAKKPWWLLAGVAAGLYAIYRLITG
jgi:hypothetical protein